MISASIVQLLVLLVVGGLIWSLVTQYLPLPEPVKMAFSVICVILLILAVLQAFGLFGVRGLGIRTSSSNYVESSNGQAA